MIRNIKSKLETVNRTAAVVFIQPMWTSTIHLNTLWLPFEDRSVLHTRLWTPPHPSVSVPAHCCPSVPYYVCCLRLSHDDCDDETILIVNRWEFPSIPELWNVHKTYKNQPPTATLLLKLSTILNRSLVRPPPPLWGYLIAQWQSEL